jgi:chromosome segregation ATPase
LKAEKQRNEDYKKSVGQIVNKKNQRIQELEKIVQGSTTSANAKLQEKDAEIAEREKRAEELGRQNDELSLKLETLQDTLAQITTDKDDLEKKLADTTIELNSEFG